MKYQVYRMSDNSKHESNSILSIWNALGREVGFAFSSRFCLKLLVL